MRRLLSGLMALLFLPAGVWTLARAFRVGDAPHDFAMMIFSGSLTLLVGLAGLVGLAAKGRAPADMEVPDDQSAAEGGRDS
jgi:uncharacterized membrane protein HdeD (DUF308 family)